MCDLNWAKLEQTIFAALAQLNLFAAFWGRLVDDYFLVLVSWMVP